jgi:O-acetyl-ADP-ribose deacetylase
MRAVVVGGRSLAAVVGDITTIEADAIVNPANSALLPGGGASGAIHAAAGPTIAAESRERYGARGCPTGEAVVTASGRLAGHGVRWIIHACGPVWRGGGTGEPELLASVYRQACARAQELGARSIAFPAISAGIFGYPLEAAARIAIATVYDHLLGVTSLERATFVLRPNTIDAFEVALAAKGRD